MSEKKSLSIQEEKILMEQISNDPRISVESEKS